MRELDAIECGLIDGGGFWAKLITIYDAVTDGAAGLVAGAKAGYGFEEQE